MRRILIALILLTLALPVMAQETTNTLNRARLQAGSFTNTGQWVWNATDPNVLSCVEGWCFDPTYYIQKLIQSSTAGNWPIGATSAPFSPTLKLSNTSTDPNLPSESVILLGGANETVLSFWAVDGYGQVHEPAGDNPKVVLGSVTNHPLGIYTNFTPRWWISPTGTFYPEGTGLLDIGDPNHYVDDVYADTLTMTGPITGEDSDPAITIPVYPDATTDAPSIKYLTRGLTPLSAWRTMVTGSVPYDFAQDHDQVFTTTYNLSWDATNGLTKDDPNNISVKMGLESRYVSDPNQVATLKGEFEFIIDVDPNRIAAWSPSRPWAFFYNMDTEETRFTLGDGNYQTNDMVLQFNQHNGCAWCFYAVDDPLEIGTAVFGHQDVMNDPNNLGAITSQGRFTIDPGNKGSWGTDPNVSDRTAGVRNFSSGNLSIYAGLNGSAVPQDIYLGDDARPSDIHIGNAIGTERFGIKGAADQVQARVLGFAGQSNQLYEIGTATKVLFAVNPFSGIGIGDGAGWAGLIDADGYQNQVQLYVKGHSTQTNPLANFEQSDPNIDVFTVHNAKVEIPNHYLEVADTCLSEDTDRLFGDKDCDDTKDAGEEYLDGTPGFSGTATLDFASALISACSADLTITVTGAVDGMPCSVGVPNGSMAAGSMFQCWVSASNTVSVRHCCQAGAACDPASGTFGAHVRAP